MHEVGAPIDSQAWTGKRLGPIEDVETPEELWRARYAKFGVLRPTIGSILGTTASVVVPLQIIPAKLVNESWNGFFLVSCLFCLSFVVLVHGLSGKHRWIGKIQKTVGRAAVLLSIVPGIFTLAAYRQATPTPAVRAYVGIETLHRGGAWIHAATAENRDYVWADRTPVTIESPCLSIQSYRALGYEWLKIGQLSSRTTSSPWSIDQARCFADRALEPIGQR